MQSTFALLIHACIRTLTCARTHACTLTYLQAGNLVGFEQVKDIHLDAEPWTPEDILTPTFKLKRADAKRRYIEQIDAMYSVLDPVAGARGLRQGDA